MQRCQTDARQGNLLRAEMLSQQDRNRRHYEVHHKNDSHIRAELERIRSTVIEALNRRQKQSAAIHGLGQFEGRKRVDNLDKYQNLRDNLKPSRRKNILAKSEDFAAQGRGGTQSIVLTYQAAQAVDHGGRHKVKTLAFDIALH